MKKKAKPKSGSPAASRRIDALRKKIDDIDGRILGMINRRLKLAEEIGRVKSRTGNQVIDSARELLLLRNLAEINPGPLTNTALRHIYTEIIAAARAIQKPQQVAYLGPEATFTHIAAMNHFGRAVEFSPQASIPDVFNSVEKRSFNYGVVPVENSIEGAVNYTLDLFFESDLKICAEIYYAISHDLLSKTASLKDITRIYSHPHAFAQCRQWLRQNLPDTDLVECSSTAEAAQRASREAGTAAISSREAADFYKLKVVAPGIEDLSRNITRFLVIGREAVGRTARDKTSIMFVTAHVPGALYRVLQPLAEADINMLKLESRPTKHENWHYFFFVDVEGHIKDPLVSGTIAKMKNLCFFLKILGSYPRADEDARGAE